jgi:Holliday junction resolvase YEN1
MGIHGIYKEIGPGQRIALAKLASDTYIQTGKPLRLAIDISIWLFQIQSGKGNIYFKMRMSSYLTHLRW